ncbi:MAG TPA: tRNA-guanine transglycosylase, partial [Beijerinckiaceae bacterium]|nr:tRNA-guanine transglycosylase [Beijerinckiaceae bacterium]
AANTYSKAYLHHLVRSNEILGMMLLTWNNLAYYQDLMAGLRKAVAEGRLDDFIGETKESWARGERDGGGSIDGRDGADGS